MYVRLICLIHLITVDQHLSVKASGIKQLPKEWGAGEEDRPRQNATYASMSGASV